MQQHAAVLPHAIVFFEFLDVPLIHVDVMDAVSRLEAEVFVTVVRLRPPAFAEGINHRMFFGQGPLDMMVDFLIQIVVGPGISNGSGTMLSGANRLARK